VKWLCRPRSLAGLDLPDDELPEPEEEGIPEVTVAVEGQACGQLSDSCSGATCAYIFLYAVVRGHLTSR
jgi:hypothetical protein